MKILLYPHKKIEKTRLGWGLSFIDGIEMGTRITFDVAFHWNYNDIKTPVDEIDFLINGPQTVYNISLRSVAKKWVDEHMTEALGYSSLVEALPGRDTVCVVKRNEQSRGQAHISKVIWDNNHLDKRHPDYRISQKFIETERDGACEEHRVFIFCNNSFTVKKRKRFKDRFKSNASEYKLIETADIFSQEEIKGISRFTNSIGLDFGEIDVLRDNDNGKIYITDVNDIAGGKGKLAGMEDVKDRYVYELKRMLGC